ncbi:hypothetical protein PHLCEN_2v8166 [Hermanssonia centrifuga]|uniref:Uncharacterized protein n=1 Tax=Hermanssonia centrifuga TaxID=98765 RepID=A0A2R6NUH4_9APHY|nr:hypothetical protein PHLCEN_2v8166 [Hermanssonia centrifuga]
MGADLDHGPAEGMDGEAEDDEDGTQREEIDPVDAPAEHHLSELLGTKNTCDIQEVKFPNPLYQSLC